MKRIVTFALIVFSALFIWSIGIVSAQKITGLKDSIELRYTEPTLSLEQLEKIQEGESAHKEPLIKYLTAWEQVDDVDIENKELGKKIKATMIYVFGDMKELISKSQIAGDFPNSEDEEGAMITSKVAYDLWGSLDVVNKTFYYEGRLYKVRGVIDYEEPAILVQLNKEVEEIQISQLRIGFRETENILGELKNFQMRYRLEEGIVVNLSLISTLWGQIIYMPIWILGIWGMIKLYKVLYKTYHYWVDSILFIGIISVVSWIIMRFMIISIDIPSYLLPNQWSDFEFWSNLYDNFKVNHVAIKSLPKYLPDIWREENVNWIGSLWFISSSMTILGVRKIIIRDSSDLFWKIIISITLSFIVIIIDYLIGITFAIPEAFWIGQPIFLIICYICNQWLRILESTDNE